ncbi:MAG: hypothetical protein MI673_04585 [Thiotrichales bacterium]|nr:hypothetical protein [Thiotrichales bacterium]
MQRALRRQLGQSMIEYTIVVGLGVMALTAAMSSGGSEQAANFPDTYSAKEALWQRMRDHYTGYSFAISITEYPDANTITDLETLYIAQGIPDDLREYMNDYPDQFVTALGNFANGNIPGLSNALDMINNVDVSPSTFLNPSFP